MYHQNFLNNGGRTVLLHCASLFPLYASNLKAVSIKNSEKALFSCSGAFSVHDLTDNFHKFDKALFVMANFVIDREARYVFVYKNSTFTVLKYRPVDLARGFRAP